MKLKNIIYAIAASAITAFCISVQNAAAVSPVGLAMVVPAAIIPKDNRAVPSTITEATVFFSGAELTHTARAQLGSGANEIRIEGLSPHIDMNSLKVKVSDNVVVASVEFSVDYINTAKETRPLLKELQDKITDRTDEMGKVDIDLRINENMLSLLKDGITKNVSGSDNGLSTDELKKTLDYYKAKSEELEKVRAELGKKRAELALEIQNLQNQYNQESVKGNKTSGVLSISLSSPRAVDASFAISYFTYNASWTPYYDINVASTDKPVSIMARSKVSQTTGLDWEKVKLTLSTAAPSAGKVAPLFNAWFLRPVVKEVTGQLMGRAAGVMVQNSYSYDKRADIVAVDEELSAPAASVMENYITTTENALNVTYQIDMPYSIPGNGKEQTIDMFIKETHADYKYYATPKLDSRTYLIAEIPDWQDLGLLSGTANITYDGTYIGATHIDASSTSEKLTLTLGTDPRVAVKREKLQDFSSTKIIGNDTQQIFTYRITVKNNQTKPVKLVTKDQYPISTQKNIEVSLRTKETTPWTANVETVGVITWEEEIAPGQSKTYDISYSVRYPKGMALNL